MKEGIKTFTGGCLPNWGTIGPASGRTPVEQVSRGHLVQADQKVLNEKGAPASCHGTASDYPIWQLH